MDAKSPSYVEGFERTHLICFNVVPDTVGGSLGNFQKFLEFSVETIKNPLPSCPHGQVPRKAKHM